MTHITQRSADMAMWQAFIMANGDPNCGDLQDAWDFLGEDAMQDFAIKASDACQLIWFSAPPDYHVARAYSDFCADFLKLTHWSVSTINGKTVHGIYWPSSGEMLDELFPPINGD